MGMIYAITKWTNDDVAAISVIAMSKNELTEKNA